MISVTVYPLDSTLRGADRNTEFLPSLAVDCFEPVDHGAVTPMLARAVLALVLVARAGAQRGSPFRCRDRDPQCKTWAGRVRARANREVGAPGM